MASYCSFARNLPEDNVHRIHHDTEHGFPNRTDNELFGQLILEINQAGLSWDIILKKRATLKTAYADFDIQTVANFTEADRTRLLKDPGIIRNKLKVNAVIFNANRILEFQQSHGSWKNWLLATHPLSKEEWIKCFKKHFKFTGGEIVNEFLMSTGFLPGAHDKDCPVAQEILKLEPAWKNTVH